MDSAKQRGWRTKQGGSQCCKLRGYGETLHASGLAETVTAATILVNEDSHLDTDGQLSLTVILGHEFGFPQSSL